MPVNEDNGSNVTTPVVGLTVYVPSPGTVNDDLSHEFGFWTGSIPHNLTVVPTKGKSTAPGESLANGSIV